MGNNLLTSNIIAGTMKWGQWGAKFNTDEYLNMIERCIEYGVTSFDHADIYGNYTTENEFGKALQLKPSIRSQIQIITKCGINLIGENSLHTIKHYDTGKEHIIESVENSLRNFHTDYIDFLLIHRPDPLMNPAEIAEVFSSLQQQGKVLKFGVSNFNKSQAEMLHHFFPIAANQVEISILHLASFVNGDLNHCILEDIVPMAWSPLGGGKFFNKEEDRNKRILAVAHILAEKYDATLDQILLAWLYKHPSNIKPVIGTVRPERILKAVKASSIKLSTEEWFMLWRASTGHEVD